MTVNYYLLKKHIFKQRNSLIKKYQKKKLKFGSLGFLSCKKQQFEFVYLRFFKKLLRRKYYKIHTRFKKSYFWLFIKANFIYSAKSKNARMGAGVGILIRLIWIIYRYTSLIEFINYPYKHLWKVKNYLNFKCNINIFLYKLFGSLFLLILSNVFLFSFIFWFLTLICKWFYSNKYFNYKLNYYECGFKSITNVKINYNINFILLILFLLIYDGEFIILLPFSLNFSLLNFFIFIIIFLFFIWLVFSLLIDYSFNALEWQI